MKFLLLASWLLIYVINCAEGDPLTKINLILQIHQEVGSACKFGCGSHRESSCWSVLTNSYLPHGYTGFHDCVEYTCTHGTWVPTGVTDSDCENGLYNGTHLDDLEDYEIWLHILNHFDQPFEDRFHPRGDNKYTYHLDNEEVLPDKYQNPIIIPAIDDFTTENKDLENLLKFPKGEKEVPSYFDNTTKIALNEYYGFYLKNPTPQGILKVAVNGKDHVNEYLHIMTLMHLLIYNNAVDWYEVPPLYDVFPGAFTRTNSASTENCDVLEEYPQDLTEEEWKVSYYREDAALNDFHGSWHFYNPFYADNVQLTHGELFYYTHNQFIARYDMERLSIGLARVSPLSNWDPEDLIPENYIPPVLVNTLTRCANMSAKVLGTELKPYRLNLENDLDSGWLLNKTDGGLIMINDNNGTKYVGCALEAANCGSFPTARYNTLGIHNTGHILISINISCPGVPLGKKGVMFDTWSSVRDPIFWRWHKYIDKTFRRNKNNLPQYNLDQLVMNGVKVTKFEMYSQEKLGEVHTFNSRRNLTMWLNETASLCISQPHHDHYPFQYQIEIENDWHTADPIDVNVRIFLAPKVTSTTNYEDQRLLWTLMDRFHVILSDQNHTIVRGSCNSSVTVRSPKSLKELKDNLKSESSYNEYKSKPATCQCGLPEHLLIPRGKPEGMDFQLFVYVTPFINKKEVLPDCKNPECSDLCNYKCFLHSGEPMGFPFDRKMTSLDGSPINTINDLNAKLSNAALNDIKIIYNKDLTINERQCKN